MYNQKKLKSNKKLLLPFLALFFALLIPVSQASAAYSSWATVGPNKTYDSTSIYVQAGQSVNVTVHNTGNSSFNFRVTSGGKTITSGMVSAGASKSYSTGVPVGTAVLHLQCTSSCSGQGRLQTY
ncbi:G1 family glutamic endopeptidase [Hazenella coriacea]|uniref:EfeO-type cupredoxin-like domain-containing protein n=1 Tax=Hazenella coriacea TaxID=1179467 RepID=A0A4R3L9R5_9BACL|nr:G1 family glutamic endopeptidase [Hazenella coriacea]TCS95855.1 hypothetical protein EDD58_102437 [Hazenella coriacea]